MINTLNITRYIHVMTNFIIYHFFSLQLTHNHQSQWLQHLKKKQCSFASRKRWLERKSKQTPNFKTRSNQQWKSICSQWTTTLTGHGRWNSGLSSTTFGWIPKRTQQNWQEMTSSRTKMHSNSLHQPKTAIVLTDIHGRIQAIKHQPGQSIESHLKKLEAQFARFHEIDRKLSDDHLAALILSIVNDSPDFASVFRLCDVGRNTLSG